MKVDGVFSGGGVKAIAFVGALEVVDEKGLTFERVAGTSAGAILASLIAAGYKTSEIKDLFMDLDLESFMEESTIEKVFPFLKWLLIYKRLGLYKGDELEKWIADKLSAKGIYTFEDLKPGALKIIASDVSLGKIVVFPDDLERLYGIDGLSFPIARAVRISASIPFFFIPIKRIEPKSQKKPKSRKNILVDGGLLSNFPIWVFQSGMKKPKRPILGMKLSSSFDQLPKRKINNAIAMFQALFGTMINAHDARYISKSVATKVMFLPTEEFDATDFSLSAAEKRRLMAIGRNSASNYFKTWTS
ncbi:NTE family protein [Salinibacillus kushneri]|uniref:NTE family protein n=1 Tax=Salinibacillus kushneri TaxID=237682 RepID=A0A1I0FVF0_9BACI|nr:patatin-like phospholipase family protein [Salinibacillus kushneri]SET61643.1 NTE family protein [Salinibacillus kushneri]